MTESRLESFAASLGFSVDVGAVRVEVIAPTGTIVFDGPLVRLSAEACAAFPPGDHDVYATIDGLPQRLTERVHAGTLHVPGVAA